MNLKRHLKQAKNRFNQKLELLAAAYLKECNIPASQAKLCQETRGETLHLWFEKHDVKASIADTHPDIQHMFALLNIYNNRAKDFNKQDDIDFKSMVADLMRKYEEADTAKTEGRVADDRSFTELVDGVQS